MKNTTKTPLEDSKQKTLDCIREHINNCGYSPSVRDLMKKLDFKSPSSVYYYLQALRDDGKITWVKGVSHSITLLEETEEEAGEKKPEILYKATIPVAPITKKNSQEIHVDKRTGRRWISQSSQYRAYEAKAGWYLTGSPNINEPVNVKMVFYMPTKRRVDLSNLQSACLDVLVNNGIIADDNANIVHSHDFSRVEYDHDNPRTEIEITKI